MFDRKGQLNDGDQIVGIESEDALVVIAANEERVQMFGKNNEHRELQ